MQLPQHRPAAADVRQRGRPRDARRPGQLWLAERAERHEFVRAARRGTDGRAVCAGLRELQLRGARWAGGALCRGEGQVRRGAHLQCARPAGARDVALRRAGPYGVLAALARHEGPGAASARHLGGADQARELQLRGQGEACVYAQGAGCDRVQRPGLEQFG